MKPSARLRSFLLFTDSSILAITCAPAAICWDGTSGSWNTIANWSTVSGAATCSPRSN